MPELIQVLQNPLFLFFIVTSILIVWFYIVYYTKKKTTTKTKELTDKMIFLAIGVLFGISFVLFFIDYVLQISAIDTKGDMSNWATLVIEIGIGITIGSIIFLYSNSKQTESTKDISTVKDISHKLDDMIEDVKKTNDEQSKMIKEMKPIIEKQGKIIEQNQNQKSKRIQRLLDVVYPIMDGIRSDVETELADFEENDRKLNAYQTKEDVIDFLDSVIKDCDHIFKTIHVCEEIVDPEIFEILNTIRFDLTLSKTAVGQNKEIQFVLSTLENVDGNLMNVRKLLSNSID